MNDEYLINAIINRITHDANTSDDVKITVDDELNSIQSRKNELTIELTQINNEIEDINNSEILKRLNELRLKSQRIKTTLNKCNKRENILKSINKNKEISVNRIEDSVKSIEFINRLRDQKTLVLPNNDIAYNISAHAILRFIQRYGCDVPYLVLTDIVDVLNSTYKVKLKPEYNIIELLNHNCVNAEFYRTKDDIGLIFVVLDGLVITIFKDDFDKFEV